MSQATFSAIRNNVNISRRIGNSNSKIVNKLTTGLRIFSASDDVAGLSISEKMKAQIRGLEQATRNIQDGISLLQTAEGGLSEIENPNLQRMRELVLQAMNGTLSYNVNNSMFAQANQIPQGVLQLLR